MLLSHIMLSGLPCRDLLQKFQHKLVILFKLMMLERRVSSLVTLYFFGVFSYLLCSVYNFFTILQFLVSVAKVICIVNCWGKYVAFLTLCLVYCSYRVNSNYTRVLDMCKFLLCVVAYVDRYTVSYSKHYNLVLVKNCDYCMPVCSHVARWQPSARFMTVCNL